MPSPRSRRGREAGSGSSRSRLGHGRPPRPPLLLGPHIPLLVSGCCRRGRVLTAPGRTQGRAAREPNAPPGPGPATKRGRQKSGGAVALPARCRQSGLGSAPQCCSGTASLFGLCAQKAFASQLSSTRGGSAPTPPKLLAAPGTLSEALEALRAPLSPASLSPSHPSSSSERGSPRPLPPSTATPQETPELSELLGGAPAKRRSSHASPGAARPPNHVFSFNFPKVILNRAPCSAGTMRGSGAPAAGGTAWPAPPRAAGPKPGQV